MKLIKPSYTIIEQDFGIEGIYKQIELAGRTCYKSEDKITETSAKEFVDRMIRSGHGAMLEHGTVYLKCPGSSVFTLVQRHGYWDYEKNSYSKVIHNLELRDGVFPIDNCYITTNYRVLVENGWLDDLKYICEPTEIHEKRITVKFICDRGVSHEFVRHRVFSFAQESTRYCNYSKDKFNNEITFIQPCWVLDEDNSVHAENIFVDSLCKAEKDYFELLKEGWKPQQARAVLPNALKTELVMTGFISDWEHFFKLRDVIAAHPQARELAEPLHKEFIKLGYCKE